MDLRHGAVLALLLPIRRGTSSTGCGGGPGGTHLTPTDPWLIRSRRISCFSEGGEKEEDQGAFFVARR